MLSRLILICITVLFLNIPALLANGSDPKYYHISTTENLKKEVKTITPAKKITKEEAKENKTTNNKPEHNKYYRISISK